jgi:acetyl-CoA C-acetyltransferase
MTANLDVDQGGAILICSVAAAEAAGVTGDRWVFPWSGVAAADHWFPTNRWAFDESPAMRFAGRRALELAGLGVDDCELLDLYSCFPVAVQVAQHELAIDPARPFTVTGGLTFAAGPLNSYCMLALTRAVSLLREDVTRRALLTGNGGYFTKHSMLVLSGTPSGGGFATDDVQAQVDALPSRPTPDATCDPGAATLEAYTVLHDRHGNPTRAILAALDETGSRHFTTADDPGVLEQLLTTDSCGTALTELAAHNAPTPVPTPPVE